MKLLIFTQKIDRNDPILGFFHRWVEEFAKYFDKLIVICLEERKHNLPSNVEILSLGKEDGRSKMEYLFRFFKYIWQQRKEYDATFVHMNQEYVVLGGLFWKLWDKRIFMWRNHPKGNLFTYIAVWFSNKVFCTSRSSFIAKFKKTTLMPVGINTDIFDTKSRTEDYESYKNKVLFLGRIAPIKNPHIFVEALGIMNKKGITFEANIYGDPLPKDEEYHQSLKTAVKELDLNKKVKFFNSISNDKTPEIYSSHEIFVNLSPSGSFDKTILEAAACGCVIIIANQSLKGEINGEMITKNLNPESVSERIEFWLKASEKEKKLASKELQKYVLEKHSLKLLITNLSNVILI